MPTCILAYALNIVYIIYHKTHFCTFRQVYEWKLDGNNLTNTGVEIIVSGYFDVIWRTSMKATCLIVLHHRYKNKWNWEEFKLK